MSHTDGGSIRVLHVDDEPDLAEVVALHLERERDTLAVLTETSANDGLARLRDTEVDCIVSDHDMPGMNGLSFLEAVRETYPNLPFILFTGKGSEEIASEAISAGVTDYIQKEVGTDQYTVLANRIERAVDATRARDALEESERMLSTLISNLSGMAYRCQNEPEWPMEFVSDGCREVTGYDPEQLESGAVEWGTDIVHPDDRDSVWETVQGALDDEDSFEVTYRIQTEDGETRWLWEQGRGVYEWDTLVAIEGFVTDITERKHAQNRRRKYETIVESMDDGAFILDAECEFEFVNQPFVDATGVERSAVLGVDAAAFVAGADSATHAQFETAFDRLETGDAAQVELEVDLELPNRGERTLNVRLSRLATDGQFEGVVGVSRDITARKTRERELERYRRLVETAGDPMYVLDADGHFTMANGACTSQFGYTREEILGTNIRRFMDDADIDRGTDLLLDVLDDDDRSSCRLEFTIEDADGRERRVENNQAPLTDETGEFVGSVGILRDITERTKREQELEAYEMLVENVGDPMYALDADGTITMANEAMAAHLDRTREDIVGDDVASFMPASDIETGTEVITDLLSSGRQWDSFEMTTIGADGERKQTEDKIAVLTDDDGAYAGSVGVIRDITERKERERELQRYETIIQAVGDPVYSLDPDGDFTFVNDAIEPTTGHDPADLVGEHVSTVMPDEDVATARHLIEELLQSDGRRNATFEMSLVTPDGTHIPSENHMALLPFEASGDFRGTAGVVRDITDRKQREQRLEQFASVASHDLRNPLNVITGRVEYMQETGDTAHLDPVADAAERMERLIDDLLTLAQQGQTVGETEPVALDTVVDTAWTQTRTEAATLVVEDSLGTVSADPGRLRELFENLFANAIDHGLAGPDGETDGLRIRLGVVEADGDADASPAGLYVADDGVGIPTEDRDQVFEHGYTETENGTGLGLAIVRNIAEAHGWQVSVTDSWADGARFEITGFD